jgi:diguanylate cyclase (GGDEF)-like protein
VTAENLIPPAADKGARILIVDDEPATAREVGSIIERLGHEAVLCHSWTEAVRAFGTEDIDLVLMDAVMPTVDGFKLTKILRARATSYVPIVFVTGLADRGAREQGIAAGADDFLTKPLDALELKVRLTAMLRIRWLTRDLEAKTRALSKIATVDALTGVGNRRAFDERLRLELRRAREESRPLSILLLDVDHFKLVNDTFGHTAGDDLLVSIGHMLSELTRVCDVPFRYGGEEFAIIATDTTASQAVHLAERIRSAFHLRTRGATRGGPQTVSIGLCGTDQLGPDPTPTAMLVGADGALYRAKGSGRNRVCKYDEELDARAA